MEVSFIETDNEGKYSAKLKTVVSGFKIERECEVESIDEKDKPQLKQYAISNLIGNFYEQIKEVENMAAKNK